NYINPAALNAAGFLRLGNEILRAFSAVYMLQGRVRTVSNPRLTPQVLTVEMIPIFEIAL
ncbi:hypothetical protein ACQZ4O_00005, partial [Agrobacterium vitis]